jgi:DNA polymerase III subunit epsilon
MHAVSDPQLPLDFDTTAQALPASASKKRPFKTSKPAQPKLAQMPDPATMAAALAAHPDYRVVRRLVPTLQFEGRPKGPVKRVLVLDTETTGLNQAQDKIIELAMLRVDVDSATGLPVGAVTVYDGMEDPGFPISKEIEAITGISSEMVRGHRLDEDQITALLADADLVIAHNAGFDRPFCEARLPAFADLDWGCSFAEIDWKKEGHGSAKLEYLALDAGWFYEAHRAEVDCHALLAVLAQPLASTGGTALGRILAGSARPSYRLQANNAPFEAKDQLKSRGYRWSAEQRVWYTRLDDEALLAAELQWLREAVFAGRSARVQVEKMDARVKYSGREGQLSSHPI